MSEPDQAPAAKKAEFLAEEYRLLRGEIEARSQEQRAMERNVVIITTAVLSFLLGSQPDNPDLMKLAAIGWLIPPVVAFLALGRWLESLKMIKALADYIRRYELGVIPEQGAWEQSLYRDRQSKRGLKFISWTNVCFWTIMTGVPMAIAIKHALSSVQWNLRDWTLGVASGACAAGFAFFLIDQSGLRQRDSNKTPS